MKTLFFALCLLFSCVSNAALIKFEPQYNSYQVGDVITLNLTISDFSETLGGFSAEILFPVSGLELLDWQFGIGFDDGLGKIPPYEEFDRLAGFLFLEDISALEADETILAVNQGTRFTFASVSFLALEAGDLLFSFDPAKFVLLGFVSNDLINVTGTDLTLTVQPAQVPAPATAMLLLAGLGVLLRRQTRK